MNSGTDWQLVESGRSGIPVYRAGEMFQKRLESGASEWLQQELANEIQILGWLPTIAVPVPDLLGFGEDYFITRKLAGQSLRDNFRRDQADRIVATLADWFRRLHGYQAPPWAADRSIVAELTEARRRCGTAEKLSLWSELCNTCPAPRPVTLTHGDPWPCNLFFEGCIGSGIIDWGRAGLGPPERDLAILDRALAHHYGPSWAVRFWQLYQSERPDRLDWYLRLHSLF